MRLLAAIVAGGALVAFAAPASAHTPTITSTCTTVTVDLDQYEPGSTVTVQIGSSTPKTSVFGEAHYRATVALDPSRTYQVTVDNRADGVHDEWDRTWSSTAPPCVPTTTKPAPTVADLTPVAAPTTTIDYCAALRGYFTENPNAPKVDGYDQRCAPAPVMDAPTAVLDSPPVIRATPEPVLAFTGAGRSQTLAFVAEGLLFVGCGLLVWRKRCLRHAIGSSRIRQE